MIDDAIVDSYAAAPRDQWRQWFAWHPVWLDREHRFTWLRTVWRRDVELGWGVSVHQRRIQEVQP